MKSRKKSLADRQAELKARLTCGTEPVANPPSNDESDSNLLEIEPSLTLAELAQKLDWSRQTTWRHFVKERKVEGVIVRYPDTSSARPKAFVRVPVSVANREYKLLKTKAGSGF